MSVSENQLETWSHIGSLVQSASTYQSIKAVIESRDSPYMNRGITSYLQGSYGNDTNIIGAEGDVDIVLRNKNVYYPDLHKLPADQKAHYDRIRTGASYSVEQFRIDVESWLRENYGKDFDPGTKALKIKGNGNRRPADVLACCQYRRYLRFNGREDSSWIEGVCFKLPNGKLIANFPRQHQENCVKKHQETDRYFKAMVRIWKNMRNNMQERGIIQSGIAPSYYIEGLLWNVPSHLFGQSYERTFLQCYSYLHYADKTQLVCANQNAWLIRKDETTSWDPEHFNRFFNALGGYWDSFS